MYLYLLWTGLGVGWCLAIAVGGDGVLVDVPARWLVAGTGVWFVVAVLLLRAVALAGRRP